MDVAEGEVDLRSMERERANEIEEQAQQADAARMLAHLDERRPTPDGISHRPFAREVG